MLAAPLVSLLALAIPYQPGPALVPRVVVVPQDEVARLAAPSIEIQLAQRGLAVVSLEAVWAALRANAAARPAWSEAEARRARGLQAEQDLDLDTAISELERARELFTQAGAPALDPGLYAALLAELARCRDEHGDAAETEATLREWARIPGPPLDERSFPPPLVERAQRARAQVVPVLPVPALSEILGSGLVERAVVVSRVGPPGGEVLSLLSYPRGSPAPDRSATVPLAVPASERNAVLEMAIDSLAGGRTLPPPRSVVPPTSAPSTSAPPPVPDPTRTYTLAVGLIFPHAYGYSHFDRGTTGIGLSLAARVPGGPKNAELGLRLDLITGAYGIEQIAGTARWTRSRASWSFSFEPAIGLQVREGDTGRYVDLNDGPPAAVALFVEIGGAATWHLNDEWSLEEGVTVGLNVLASNYDLNVPVSFRTSLSYRF